MFDLYNPLSCLSYFIFINVTDFTIDIIEKESYVHKCLDNMFHKEKKNKKLASLNFKEDEVKIFTVSPHPLKLNFDIAAMLLLQL